MSSDMPPDGGVILCHWAQWYFRLAVKVILYSPFTREAHITAEGHITPGRGIELAAGEYN